MKPHANRTRARSWSDFLYDPKVRGAIYQAAVALALVWLVWSIVDNTVRNLEAQGIASGFDFLGRTAGFDISQSLISYSNVDTYSRAFLVGLLNTLLVAGVGIFLATIVGFIIGIARLSQNWLIRALATTYVETLRNIPPLLMLFGVYFGVLKNLPSPRESLALPFSSYLNVRGLYIPAPIAGEGMWLAALALCVGIAIAVWLKVRAARIQRETGEQVGVLIPVLGAIIGLPLVAFALTGFPLTFDVPEQGRFNLKGGLVVQPEFTALVLGLSLYTAAFIAEIVRAGILSVHKGQREAAFAVGLNQGQVLRLVVIPQALRVIIPPLTNQYLNLTKNSSLAVAIGYPDLVSVFAGTVLNQTNQAVEVILITMAVYLALSLITSILMNWFNARMALVER
ncbi:MAG: amino acid ABC transporter permease [Alphaproteobacteria bacterium]|nr:amino acid ABC transporter permease [Alphaproteobacteria bacterium]